MYSALRGNFLEREFFWFPARWLGTLIGDFLECELFTKPMPE